MEGIEEGWEGRGEGGRRRGRREVSRGGCGSKVKIKKRKTRWEKDENGSTKNILMASEWEVERSKKGRRKAVKNILSGTES